MKTIALTAVVGAGLIAAAYAGDELSRAWQDPSYETPRSAPVEVEPRWNPHDQQAGREGLRIPAGHLPPPGSCRLWYSDRPAGHQPPPGDCGVLESMISEGIRLIRS